MARVEDAAPQHGGLAAQGVSGAGQPGTFCEKHSWLIGVHDGSGQAGVFHSRGGRGAPSALQETMDVHSHLFEEQSAVTAAALDAAYARAADSVRIPRIASGA